MIDELNAAVETYYAQWRELVAARQDKTFFQALKLSSVGWKTEDIVDFNQRFAQLRDHCDQIHLAWVNERWLATLHLRDKPLAHGISLVKLMQRRPGSSDAVGLDHLDFLVPKDRDAKAALAGESGLKWSEEHNGKHSKWLSIWFASTEAKLRSDTVIDVCIAEFNEVNQAVRGAS